MEPVDSEVESNARYRLASYIETRCMSLGLRCCCPYLTNDAAEGEVVFVGHLPQFFSIRGVLIDLHDFDPAGRKKRAAVAKHLEMPISFVNPASFLEGEAGLIDALLDWGFRGNVSDLNEEVAAQLLKPSPYT